MLSLATQRFVAGVAHDAMQGARRRAAAARAGTARHSKKTVLSVEDVAEALQEVGEGMDGVKGAGRGVLGRL